MPANLSPEYKAAEAALRKAREPRERLDCLREMLRTIPKHKGTDHLPAVSTEHPVNMRACGARPGSRGSTWAASISAAISY